MEKVFSSSPHRSIFTTVSLKKTRNMDSEGNSMMKRPCWIPSHNVLKFIIFWKQNFNNGPRFSIETTTSKESF